MAIFNSYVKHTYPTAFSDDPIPIHPHPSPSIPIHPHPSPSIPTFEDVQVAHRMDHDEEHQQNGGARQTQAIVGDLDVLRAEDRGSHFLRVKLEDEEVMVL